VSLRNLPTPKQAGALNYLFSLVYFLRADFETRGRILEFFCPDLGDENPEYLKCAGDF